MQENCTAASPTDPIYLRNQFRRPNLPAIPIETQSPQPTLSVMTSRIPNFNTASSQGISPAKSVNPFCLQFPMLEAMPVSQPSPMSGLSQQVGPSTRPPNVWTSVSTQLHLSGTETHKVPFNLHFSADSMNKRPQTTSWPIQEAHDRKSYRGTVSQEFESCTVNAQNFDSGDEHPRKERSQQQFSSQILDQISDTGGLVHGQESVPKRLSGALMDPPLQQDIDRAQHGGIQSPAVSVNDLEAFGRSLKPSNLHQTYSLLHQVQSVKNVETHPGRKVLEIKHGAGSNVNVEQVTTLAGHQMMYGHKSGARDPAPLEPNMKTRHNSFPTGDIKMLSFSSEVGEDNSIKDSSLNPQEMVTSGQSHTSCDTAAPIGTDYSQISLQMAPSWYKHYGTLRNGQMLSIYDARTAKNSAQQFLPGKPFQNVHMTTPMAQLSAAGAGQTSVWQPAAMALLANKQSPPSVLPPDISDQYLTLARPKKRKIATSELLPWHKEVTQSSKRLQNIRCLPQLALFVEYLFCTLV